MTNSLFNDIDGDDFRLIKLSLDYLDDMWEYSSDHRMYEHFEIATHKTIVDTQKFLSRLIERSKSEDAHWWFIQIKETGKVIGSLAIHDINFRKRSCEISYSVSPKYWGRGIFIKSLTSVLNNLIHNFNFRRITAVTASNNVRSINALKKVGFKEEGVFRNFYYRYDGKTFDATTLSLLDFEYIPVKN